MPLPPKSSSHHNPKAVSMETAIPTSIATNFNLKSNLINHRHHHLLSSKPKTTKLISNKTTTTSSTSTSLFTTSNSNTSTSTHGHAHILAGPHINSFRHYHRASTGYAVALLEAGRSHNVLEAVSRDVKRLSEWLPCSPKDGSSAQEVVKQCSRFRLEKHLVKLVKLLVEKGKVDLLSQVLSEFGKMYHQLLILNQHTIAAASCR